MERIHRETRAEMGTNICSVSLSRRRVTGPGALKERRTAAHGGGCGGPPSMVVMAVVVVAVVVVVVVNRSRPGFGRPGRPDP